MRKEKLCRAYKYKLPTASQLLAQAGPVENSNAYTAASPGLAIITTTSYRLRNAAANAKRRKRVTEELEPLQLQQQPKPLLQLQLLYLFLLYVNYPGVGACAPCVLDGSVLRAPK